VPWWTATGLLRAVAAGSLCYASAVAPMGATLWQPLDQHMAADVADMMAS
jgi:hypothetical protein